MSLSNPFPQSRRICDVFQEQIELFIDGELSGSENLAFLTHLKECDECAAWWSDEQAISEVLLATGLPEGGAVVSDAGELPLARPELISTGSRSWSQFILVAVAAGVLTFLMTMAFWSPTQTVAVPANSEVDVAAFSAVLTSGPLLVQERNEPWREAIEGESYGSGVSLQASSEGLAVLDVAGRGSFLLEAGAMVEVPELNLENGLVSLNVQKGRVQVEAGELRVCGKVGEMGFSSWHSTFAVDASELADTVLSVRGGNVAVRLSDGSSQILHAGDTLVHERRVQADADRLSVIRGQLGRETERTRELSTKLREANGTNGVLSKRLVQLEKELEEYHVRLASERLPLSVDEIVARYLHSVNLMNSVSVTKPDGFALGVASELRDRGLEGVIALETAFRTTSVQNEQIAVCVALGCLGGRGAIDLLKDISLDSRGCIRRAAIICLDRQTEWPLADHFLAVHLLEGDSSLGIRCLEAAARHGSEAGLSRLLQLARDRSGNSRSRGLASNALEGFSESHPAVLTFFRDVVDRWEAGESTWVLYHALRTLRAANDQACIESLKSLARNQDLRLSMRQHVMETLAALGAGMLH